MHDGQQLRLDTLGDTAVRVQWGTEISPELNEQIRSFCVLLEQANIKGVAEWVPTYTAVTLFYDPYTISYDRLAEKIAELYRRRGEREIPPAERIYIPTYYGGESGPDLEVVARHNQLSAEEVVEIHTGSEYLIYMMGFTPGFPYLGGMSKKIATPRLQTPRERIAPGSVGIAGEQTGIYSMATPGGWQIIGRTPLRLYDPDRESPMLLQAGNYLQFVSISKAEYDQIEADVQAGRYQLQKETRTH
ncbi:5-oxoprolinase subunit PxpB [Brevibacillus humidisoli]|uniref:5-oxoprolinase subunit PxpB n=1 Tax=Brevibacillus humidisoli TaxID=2895522 RepID=UPI001E3392CE|nr:5-oxoprolinase subunit PxpB [Brevibacillus humidisoli]UFJ41110.1 5-oxoprolinase subunit PxpB [Brevibacillus humidisoli]